MTRITVELEDTEIRAIVDHVYDVGYDSTALRDGINVLASSGRRPGHAHRR